MRCIILRLTESHEMFTFKENKKKYMPRHTQSGGQEEISLHSVLHWNEDKQKIVETVQLQIN